MVAKTPEYLVNHGKTGALGRFLSPSFERFARGDQVVLESQRGLSLGVVLCEANERHSRLLGPTPTGHLVRRAGDHEDNLLRTNRTREQQIFEASRIVANELALPLEILDCELSLDGQRLILQYLLAGSCDPVALMDRLSSQFAVEVWLENLAAPAAEEEEQKGGCGEPNCGRADGKSGCETCGTGGGCSSCGTGKVDMKAYFSHLRDKMEESRTPLL